jgi:tetratricopeptide (TPR) repeat protein
MRSFAFFVAALFIFSSLSGCQQRTPEERLQKAIELYQNRDTLGATLEARELIKKYPDDPKSVQAHMLLSQVYMSEQRPDDALAELDIVLQKMTQKDELGRMALKEYLYILQQQKRYKEALETIDKYQKEYASDAGTSLSLTGARAEVLGLSGETTESRNLLHHLAEGTTEPAILKIYRDMIARTYMLEKNTTGATSFYEQELAKAEDEPTKRDILVNVATLQAGSGEYEAARQSLEKATKLYESAIQDEIDLNRKAALAIELADAYSRLGNLPGAGEIYGKLFDANLNPNFGPPVISGMVQTLFREGKTTAAVEFVKKAAARFPKSPLAQQAAQMDMLMKQGMIEKVAPMDTSTLVMRWREDTTLTLGNLETFKSAMTTGSIQAVQPSGTVNPVETTATQPVSETTTATATETTGTKPA